MDRKFYVSLEAARLLKEKEYNKYGYTECTWSYDGNSKEWKLVYTADKRFQGHHLSFVYSAPTLLEAMDWLEERGIIIIVGWDSRTQKWFFIINRKGDLHVCFNSTIDDNGDDYTDRNECMNAAIKKGVELL